MKPCELNRNVLSQFLTLKVDAALLNILWLTKSDTFWE
jgi:hypothetical protein